MSSSLRFEIQFLRHRKNDMSSLGGSNDYRSLASKQRFISLNSMSQFVFIKKIDCVLCEVGTEVS